MGTLADNTDHVLKFAYPKNAGPYEVSGELKQFASKISFKKE